jgi:outer membrane protein assembly factor BamA
MLTACSVLWAMAALLPLGMAPALADSAIPAGLAGHRVAAVEVEGARITRNWIIRREIRTHPGDLLDLTVLRADQQRLENLDVFSSVSVAGHLAQDGVHLAFRVREIPSIVPYLTYDVTDQDGWSFGPALKSVNMLGLDLSVAGYALFGGKNTFLLDLSYPWLAGNHVSLDLDAERTERRNELDGFNETSFEVTPWLGTYVGDRGRLGVGVSYLRMESDRLGHTLGGDRVDHLLRVGIRAGYDSRDSWGDPRCGWLTDARLLRTGGQLPGDGDYWSLDLDARRFQPALFGHTLVLAGLTTLQSGDVGRHVPEYMDYHLGGSNSLRGHALGKLGAVLFGKNQWLSSVEYRFALVPSREYVLLGMASDLGLAGALFMDHGLAWTRRDDLRWGRSATGFGAGIRLLLPAVEMMRLDVGFSTDGHWHVHLAGFSKMTAQRLRLR